MMVHLFGGISSPSCASYALRRTADDNESRFGAEAAAAALRNNFYVDDMLKSIKSPDSAIKLISDVRAMCQAGGFRLTKFVSNDRQIIESIPVDDRAKDIRSIDLS
jgi:hypothetical protein